jgi:hypothetical protein
MRKQFLPFLAFSLLALTFALWAGLLRLGWNLPSLGGKLSANHGPVMVSGFLGALIVLERVVVLKFRWMYASPILAALGWIATLFLPGNLLGPALLTLSSAVAVAILVVMVKREPAIHTATMLIGTVTWFAANLAWLLGEPIFRVVYGWQAYLILTIMGERLELSRILKISRLNHILFVVFAAMLIMGVVWTRVDDQVGVRIMGSGMLALALWSLPNDISWRNLRHKMPVTRYIAVCLSAGLVWLGIGGVLYLVLGVQVAGPFYDALLHSIFVGFVISMIFGHAIIIFPAILGTPIYFQRAFYIHLVLLHLSLVLRILGDLTFWNQGRMWGGMLNEIAILLFLGMTIYSINRGRKQVRQVAD